MSTSQLIFTLAYFALGGGLIYLAVLILRDSAKVRLNRITSVMLFLAGLGPVFAALGTVVSPYQSGSPLKESPLYNLFYIWELFFPALLYFSWVFPFDRLEGRKMRWRWMVFVPHLFHIFLLVFVSDTDKLFGLIVFEQGDSNLLNSIKESITSVLTWILIPLGLVITSHKKFFSIINLAYVIGAVSFLYIGMKHVTADRLKKQVRVIIMGLHVSLGVYIFTFILPNLIPLELSDNLKFVLGAVMLLVGAGSIAWAIIRYQFLDVQLIIRQSLVYTASSAILVGTYLFAITRFSSFLETLFGKQMPIINIALIVLALMLFQPINAQIDNIIKRMFLRDKSDYRNIANSLSAQIINILDRQQLFQVVEKVLNTSLLIKAVGFAIYDDEQKAYIYFTSSDADPIKLSETDPLLGAIGQLKTPTFFDRIDSWNLGSNLATHFKVGGVQMIVPLNDREHLLGFMTLTDKMSGFKFGYEDSTLLSTLANQMVISLTNVRLYRESLVRQRLQEEMNLARQIQMDLLPDMPPQGKNYSIAAHSTPSRTVGGDFYDFMEIDSKGSFGMVIADVSGKGMPAALLAAQIQAVIRSQSGRSDVGEAIANVNKLITNLSSSSGKYATLFYGEFDPEKSTFEFSNAGHNYPLLIKADGSHEFLRAGGTVIGAFEQVSYDSQSVKLDPNDLLFLYTDGLSEAMNSDDEEYGEDRILEFLKKNRTRSSEDIRAGILADVERFAGAGVAEDDTTLIVFKINGTDSND